jgi:hypothetical protein
VNVPNVHVTPPRNLFQLRLRNIPMLLLQLAQVLDDRCGLAALEQEGWDEFGWGGTHGPVVPSGLLPRVTNAIALRPLSNRAPRTRRKFPLPSRFCE